MMPRVMRADPAGAGTGTGAAADAADFGDEAGDGDADNGTAADDTATATDATADGAGVCACGQTDGVVAPAIAELACATAKTSDDSDDVGPVMEDENSSVDVEMEMARSSLFGFWGRSSSSVDWGFCMALLFVF